MFTERTQVLLSREQRERLERMASREGRSVGSVIRRSRADAAAALIAMELPVGDWDQMKAEIVEAALAGLPDPGDSSRAHRGHRLS